MNILNRQNRYTPDVMMAIEHLEEALVEIGASVNESRVTNRSYIDTEPTMPPTRLDFSMFEQKDLSYADFEASLLKSKGETGTLDEGEEGEGIDFDLSMQLGRRAVFESTGVHIELEHAESPSIIINDLLGEKKEAMVHLLETTFREMGEEDKSMLTSKKSATGQESKTSITEDYVAFRNELIDKTIRQLEEIKKLDETLNSLKCQANPDQIAALKDMVNSSQ